MDSLINMARTGRPTKYKKKYIKMIDEYIESCKDEIEKTSKYEGSQGSIDYDIRLTVKLPTIEGFALFIGVVVSTLYEWRKDHDDFSKALEMLKDIQKERLISKGLAGQYNSTICSLILSSNHGMARKSDLMSGGEPLKGNTIVVRDFSKADDTEDEEDQG